MKKKLKLINDRINDVAFGYFLYLINKKGKYRFRSVEMEYWNYIINWYNTIIILFSKT